MSFANALSLPDRSSPRWLLLASLALNLFFIGLAAALWVRGPAPLDRSAPARIERLAAALPASDAEILRRMYILNSGSLLLEQSRYEKAREDIRAELRREQLDPTELNLAMARTREARQAFDRLLQGIIADASTQMSLDGRRRLANYSPSTRRTPR